jgi:hypothetical protein
MDEQRRYHTQYDTEDGSNIFFRNVGINLQHYMTSTPRTTICKYSSNFSVSVSFFHLLKMRVPIRQSKKPGGTFLRMRVRDII